MTTSRTQRAQRGYTVLELVFIAAFIPILFGAVAQVYGGSEDLVETSRAGLQAHETLRRNLEAVANAVRDADLDSVDWSSFDDEGWSSTPTFARVIGADATGRIHDGAEVLEWRPTQQDVDGVSAPGAVWHVTPDRETLLADRVPAGGFRVRFDAGTLVIHLSNWHRTSAGRIAWVEGETAVALRN